MKNELISLYNKMFSANFKTLKDVRFDMGSRTRIRGIKKRENITLLLKYFEIILKDKNEAAKSLVWNYLYEFEDSYCSNRFDKIIKEDTEPLFSQALKEYKANSKLKEEIEQDSYMKNQTNVFITQDLIIKPYKCTQEDEDYEMYCEDIEDEEDYDNCGNYVQIFNKEEYEEDEEDREMEEKSRKEDEDRYRDIKTMYLDFTNDPDQTRFDVFLRKDNSLVGRIQLSVPEALIGKEKTLNEFIPAFKDDVKKEEYIIQAGKVIIDAALNDKILIYSENSSKSCPFRGKMISQPKKVEAVFMTCKESEEKTISVAKRIGFYDAGGILVPKDGKNERIIYFYKAKNN